MKICGIIAEYNPFHSGHAHHIEMTKKNTGCDHVVCLMSGCFTQRGEPAIFDKWQRAKSAVSCGADLVLELPTLYALRSAEGFAYGSVRILHDLNMDFLSFGSEIDDMEALKEISSVLLDEPDKYREFLKESLSEGLSFPASRQQALSSYTQNRDISNILTGSNSILGIEYLKAIGRTNSTILPSIVKRKGKAYNDEDIFDSLSSATAIRKYIFENGMDDLIYQNMPKEAFDVLVDRIDSGFIPVRKEAFFSSLIYAIRKYSKEELSNILDVTEGLENKIKKAAQVSKNYDELIDNIKSKRFTHTRIQRILCYILLGITKEISEYADKNTPVNIKVLAYRKKSNILLSHFTKYTDINLYHSAAGLDEDPFTKMDIRATDIYSLSQEKNKFYKSNQDFTNRTKTD